MRVSAIIPNQGRVVTELGLNAMGEAAEVSGVSGLWLSDHLLMVDTDAREYPFSSDGRPPWALDTDYFEALTCCAFLLSATRTCRVGTAVLLAAQRHVLELAKVTATLDRLSGGRLNLGVGAGWSRSEMSALGFNPDTRGKRLDEMIDALRLCWSGRPEPQVGTEVTIPPNLLMFPTPVQRGGPPILVGGSSPAALRRAGQTGDGWLGITYVASFDSRDLADQVSAVRGFAGPRRFPESQLVLKLHSFPSETHQVVPLLGEVAALGFDEVIVDPPWALGIDEAKRFLRECVEHAK